MKKRWVGYLMLAAWGSWFSALLALASGLGARGAFLPDPVLCMVILVAASLPRREAFPAALVLALARIAFTVDPPAAILASYTAAALFVRAARRGVEVHGPLPRAFLCFGLVWVHGLWMTAVRAQRTVLAAEVMPDLGSLTDLGGVVSYTLPRALASGALALIFGGLLVRLPGLSALDRERMF